MKKRWLVGLLLLVGFVAALASSVVTVRPGEALVVRRFGRALPEPWGPGLHVGLPFGLDRVDRIQLDEVRRIEVGIGDEVAGPDLAPGEGEFFTADGNFLRARAVLQYRVAEPLAYLKASDQPEHLIARALESSLSRAFSRQAIDPLLRNGRAEAAALIAENMARLAKHDQLGLDILSVSLTDTRPPVEVLPDFSDAQAAASERDRRTQEAQTEAALRISRARSNAAARSETARASADRSVELAKARANRFLALLAEADQNRGLTMRRLYANALGEMLPKLRRKIISADGEAVDLSLIGVGK